MPVRVVTYARVSSETQRDRETIDPQRAEIAEVVKARAEWKLLESIEDDGVSGETIIARPGLMRVMQLARERAFDILVVMKPDRLTRSSMETDAGEILRCLREGGVQLYIPTFGGMIDLTCHMQRFMLQQMMGFSGVDKGQILKNTSSGREKALKSGAGKNCGFVPYGYRWVPDESSRAKRGRYEVVPEEAAIIQRIVSLVLADKSLLTIRGTLEDEGVPFRASRSRNGTRWCEVTIKKFLQKTTLKGELQVLAGKHTVSIPAIIDDETWRRVQRALASRRRGRPAREDRTDALLLGRLRCGVCGYACSIDGSRTRAYRCSTITSWKALRHDGPCGNGRFKVNEVDEMVWAALKRVLTSQDALLECAALQSDKVSAGVDFKAQLKSSTKRLGELEDLVEEVLDRRRRSDISQGACDKALAKLRGEREAHERQVEMSKNQLANTGDAVVWLGHIEKMADELAGTLDEMTFRQRLDVVERFLPRTKGWVELMVDGNHKVQGVLELNSKSLAFNFTTERKSA